MDAFLCWTSNVSDSGEPGLTGIGQHPLQAVRLTRWCSQSTGLFDGKSYGRDWKLVDVEQGSAPLPTKHASRRCLTAS